MFKFLVLIFTTFTILNANSFFFEIKYIESEFNINLEEFVSQKNYNDWNLTLKKRSLKEIIEEYFNDNKKLLEYVNKDELKENEELIKTIILSTSLNKV